LSEKRYEYAKLDSRLPKQEELFEQGKSLLKGFGFKEEQIHSEWRVDSLDFIVDLAGISDEFKVCVELGWCGPEKLFALKTVFDRVVWIPFWFTIIPEKPRSMTEIEAELKIEIDELRKLVFELRLERDNVYRDLGLLYNDIKKFFEKMRKRVDPYSSHSWVKDREI